MLPIIDLIKQAARKLFVPYLVLSLFLLIPGCGWVSQPSPSPSPEEPSPSVASPSPSPEPYIIKDPAGTTPETRFKPPEGFTRTPADEGSYTAFLRAIPLKPDGDVVYLYDGTIKPDDRYEAVMQMDVGPRDFMRNTNFLIYLRAAYLYQAGRYDDIEYHFLSGFAFPFSQWAEGNRISVNGNKVDWSAPAAAPDNSADAFKSYLNTLFIYTNTSSVKQDLLQAGQLESGCIFTAAGGAVAADVAEDETGRKAVLLLRGGDPEQQGYIVQNTGDPEMSPWFLVPDNGLIQTPEGELSIGDLYIFKR